jgi:hypothetical protein
MLPPKQWVLQGSEAGVVRRHPGCQLLLLQWRSCGVAQAATVTNNGDAGFSGMQALLTLR